MLLILSGNTRWRQVVRIVTADIRRRVPDILQNPMREVKKLPSGINEIPLEMFIPALDYLKSIKKIFEQTEREIIKWLQ